MKTKNSGLALLVFSILFTSGCASVGNDFKYSGPASLKLGQTHASEYLAAYGPPKSTKVTKNADGDFEASTYVYSHADQAWARVRVLVLESRNGVLNAYDFVSSFDEDKSSAKMDRFSEIQRGAATKADVLKIMGEPHGRALCPSSIRDFKERSAKGAEVWVWNMMAPLSTYGHVYAGQQIQRSSVYVTFDANGVVTEVESVDGTK